MKVSELMAALEKCSQDSDVTVVCDDYYNPMNGKNLNHVVEIRFPQNDGTHIVALMA